MKHLIWIAILIFAAACGPAAPLPERVALPTNEAEIAKPTDAPSDSVADAPVAVVAPATDGASYMSIGDPNAPITIVEYSDYQCPFCQRHSLETYPQLKSEFIDTGRIRYEFRDFPIPSLHPLAYRLHEAARCAGSAAGADAYWSAHDLFFTEKTRFELDSEPAMDSEIQTAFGENGLPDVSDCLIRGDFAEAVQADFVAGQAAGVTGTPAFFIDGYQISGAQPFATFSQAIIAAEEGRLAELFAPTPVPQAVVPTPATIEARASTALGNPAAPVTIVEYSDYQCPFCRRHALETMPQMMDMIDAGRLYYVFKDYPIEGLHPLAYRMHEAALCVRDVSGTDAFWETHNYFFTNVEAFAKDGTAEMDAAIVSELSAANLWNAETQSCFDNGDTAAEVQANIQEALRLGVSGTPTMFIQGFPIVGAQPYQTLELAVQLAERGELADAFAQANAPRDGKAQATAQAQAAQPVDVPVSGDEPVKGSADAPVTMIEYSSYQCPFCKRYFDQTMPQIQQLIDDGMVRYIFKDFPLTTQPQAYKVHEATRCARAQGGDDFYWQAHDIMFTNQAVWAGQPVGPHVETIKTLLSVMDGLDSAELATCIDTDRYAAAVQADLEEGVALNVRGTPSFFINGRFISGAQPFSVFQQAIAQALTESQ